TVEIPASEKTMAAAAAEAVAPVGQAGHSTPIKESMRMPPALDSVVLAEEKRAIEPEPREQKSPVAKPLSAEPGSEPVLDAVVLSEGKTPAWSLETQELEAVVAPVRSQPVPPPGAENSVADIPVSQ